MFNKILEVATNLGFPIIFMSISGWYGIRTFFHLLFSFQFRTIFSISAFKKVWFANFWSVYGAGMGEDRVRPLAEKAYGVVLDIGPGAGHWLALFEKSKITKIYGVEPNADHYELLQKRIKAAGMVDIYEIIPSSVENIHEYRIAKESFDSVVTIQCLCSISKPQEMIANLYKYIKPGGQWIVCEHVITPHTGWISWYQAGLDIFWPHFLGGCRLTRDTGRWLREAGEWSSVDLKQPESYYHVLPHAVGVLVK